MHFEPPPDIYARDLGAQDMIGDVGIDLSRGNAGVAQQSLYESNIQSSLHY